MRPDRALQPLRVSYSSAGPEALWRWPLRCRLLRLTERLNEIRERLLVHVGNGDIGEIRVGPAGDMVAVNRFYAAYSAGELGVDWQLGHRDDVLVVPIDERRRWDPVDDGHAPPHQREAFRREIDDGSADGCAVGKPRLDRMPVGGGDVEGLTGNFRAGEIRDEILGAVARARWRAQRREPRADRKP